MRSLINAVCTVTILFLHSCQENEQSNNQVGDIQISLKGLFENGVVIGNINDPKQLKSSLVLLSNEISEIRDENEEVESIVLFISNDDKKIILDGYQLISNEDKTIEFKSNTRLKEPIPAGSCPDGFTDLGTCSNFGDTEECIAGKVSAHFSNTLAGPGDCSTVQVKIGTLSSRVCGGGC